MKALLLICLLLSGVAFASVGKVTSVKGDVTLTRDSGEILVKTGLSIEEKDTISTSDSGRVQLIFNDQTIISLGKNSNFNIQEYLFDINKPQDTKANLSVSKGIFKAITGQIGKVNPAKFKLKTKSASIGIRGTVFFGDVQPGKPEVIVCTQGSITVETPNGTVVIKAGEFTTIEAGKAPTPPAPISKEQMQQLEQNSGTQKKVIQELADQKENEEVTGEVKDQVVGEAVSFTVQDLTEDILNTTTTTQTLYTKTISPVGTFPDIGYSIITDSEITTELGTGWIAKATESDSDFDWGYWGTGTFDTDAPTSNEVNAVWGKALGTVTDITTLSGTATYNGDIIGYVTDDGTNAINSGSISLNFDFGANTAGVQMTVNGVSGYDIPNNTSYSVSGNTYSITNGTDNVTGAFYNSGDRTGGSFNITKETGNTATGVYKATKAVQEVVAQ